MTNEIFINNLFESVDTLPAYNYYKADEDIKFLLKDRKIPINEVQELRLMEIHNEYKEYVMITLYEEKYKNHLKDEHYKIILNNRIVKINELTKLLELRKAEHTLMTDAFLPEELERFKSLLEGIMIPFLPLIEMQLSILERGLKGVNNEIGMIAKQNEKEVNFDYTQSVVEMSRYLKMSLRPMEISLSEWIGYNKMIMKDGK